MNDRKDFKICRFCGVAIPSHFSICPNCKKSQSNKGIIAGVSASAVAAVILVFIIGLKAGMNDRTGDQHIDEPQTTETVDIDTKTDGKTKPERSKNTEAPEAEDHGRSEPVYDTDREYSDEMLFETNEYLLDVISLEGGTLDRLSQYEARILINEMYAYHGYTFNTPEYQRYFSAKPWYISLGKSMAECEAEFNACESYNKNILVELETRKGWR